MEGWQEDMKSLGTMEKAILVLAFVFMAFGIYSVIHPTEGFVMHPSSRRSLPVSAPNPPEHVTKNGARVYGLLCVGLGTGLAWLALYRPRK